MTQNTLGNLNNHLFMQLERLGDEDMSPEELQQEIKRANAVASVAQQVVSNGELVLKARKYYDIDDRMNVNAKIPKMLEG